MEAPELALIPSGVNTGKVYSVLPNNGTGDFTFTRASEGTRIDESGLINVQGSGIPRLDWGDGDCPSLLLEPQRTNLIIFSEDFSQTYWSKQGSSNITSNTTISPDGTISADTLSDATGTNIGGDILRLNVSSVNVLSTLSIYCKSLGSDNLTIYIRNGANGSVTSQSIGLSNSEWQRVDLTSNPATGQIFFGGTNGDVAIWGAQLEQGNYASSYIGTKSAAVTRLKDECNGAGNASLFSIAEGSLFFDAYIPNSPSTTLLSLSDGTDSQKIQLNFEASNSRVRTYSSGGVLYYNTLSFNQRSKILITFKLNEYKTYINGFLVNTDTSASVPTGMDRFTFASANSLSLFFEGNVYDTRVYDKALTEAESIELTTL
jgi:hypothetical protein